MQSLLSRYAYQLHGWADGLAQESAAWNPDDYANPAERHAEIRRRQMLLWNHAVDMGAILLHATVLGGFDSSPRIRTRIFQLRAQMTAAIKTGKLPFNYRSGMPSRSSDYFLVQMFEDSCRLCPPVRKRWQPEYGREFNTADLFVRVTKELADLLSRPESVA